MSLYFSILLISVLVPLLLSFDKNIQFYKQWKYLFPAVSVVATIYIFIDILFTQSGIWGFNERYHSGIVLFGLPLEEVLFFLIIPYCSIFLFDTFEFYFPKIVFSGRLTNLLNTIFLIILACLLVLFYERAYTVYTTVSFGLAILLGMQRNNKHIQQRFYPVFGVILIPFLIVNGLLTGSFIEEEIVWYNNTENLGVRIFTIPVEDIGYGFGLIFFGLIIRSRIKNLQQKNR